MTTHTLPQRPHRSRRKAGSEDDLGGPFVPPPLPPILPFDFSSGYDRSGSEDDRRRRRRGRKHLPLGPLPPPPPPPGDIQVWNRKPSKPPKPRTQPPQTEIEEYWNNFGSQYPGKAWRLLPPEPGKKRQADKEKDKDGTQANGRRTSTLPVNKSYDDAVATCRAKVAKIAEGCRRANTKFRDNEFDIEFELSRRIGDCLMCLDQRTPDYNPGSVARVAEIFDDPQFYVEGTGATGTGSEVKQGNHGNCWLLAALCGLMVTKEAVEKICVARDEKVGVYGFVFFRDGEWIHEIIDDKLYLTKQNYLDLPLEERGKFMEVRPEHPEQEWRQQHQKGSRALYFAQCKNQNEFWLPLLEKAYAKAHNDFYSIWGGFFGEAVEDLTGGVANEVYTSDILDKDKFWDDELKKVNKLFLFGCSTGMFSTYTDTHQGLQNKHAYTILTTKEVKGKRFLKLRNPWGEREWQGAWSDGSEEWTVEWIEELGHKFGNDGVFWITYEDFLRNFTNIDRARLFDDTWCQTQLWSCFQVPWMSTWLSKKYKFSLEKPTSVVLVLSQLDPRYFYGLEGPHRFKLKFRLYRDADQEFLIESRQRYHTWRSVSAELDELAAGSYTVEVHVDAYRIKSWKPPEDVVRDKYAKNPDKVLKVARKYDEAHAKAGFSDDEQAANQRQEKKNLKSKAAERERLRRFYKRSKLRIARRDERLKQKRAKNPPLIDIGRADYDERNSVDSWNESDGGGAHEGPVNGVISINEEPSEATLTTDQQTNANTSTVDEGTVSKVHNAKAQKTASSPPPPPPPPLNSNAPAKPSSRKTSMLKPKPASPNRLRSGSRTRSSSPSSQAAPRRKSRRPPSPPRCLTLDDISSSELSWDSGADGHFNKSEASEDDGKTGRSKPKNKNKNNGRPPSHRGGGSRPRSPRPLEPAGNLNLGKRDDHAEDKEKEEWNASCVLGLRIYSKGTKDGDLSISLLDEDDVEDTDPGSEQE